VVSLDIGVPFACLSLPSVPFPFSSVIGDDNAASPWMLAIAQVVSNR
jgi:hypothetical protein